MSIISAFDFAEQIFFSLIKNKNTLEVLKKSNLFHNLTDIEHIYRKRMEYFENKDLGYVVKKDKPINDKFYQLLGYKSNYGDIDSHLDSIVQSFPFKKPNIDDFMNNLEANKKLSDIAFLDYVRSEVTISEKMPNLSDIDNPTLFSKEWLVALSARQKFYQKYPNALRHVFIIHKIIQRLVLSPIDIFPNDLFFHNKHFKRGERIDELKFQQIWMTPNLKFFRCMNKSEHIAKTYNNSVTGILIYENTIFDELDKMNEHRYEYYLSDINSMFVDLLNPLHSPFSVRIPLDVAQSACANGNHILWSIQRDESILFCNQFLLTDSTYYEYSISLLYLMTVVLWQQLNWTDDEYQEIIDGKRYENILFGERKNDTIFMLNQIFDDFIWKINNHQHSSIVI